MLSRSSSSSISLCTYGLEPSDFADSVALVRLDDAPMSSPRSFAGCRVRIPSPAKSVRKRAFLRRLECSVEHLADLLGVDELELAELVLGDLLDVALVSL